MSINPIRGLKYGVLNGLIAAIVYGVNQRISGEDIVLAEVFGFAAVATLFFGAIWTFTDKLGSEIGE